MLPPALIAALALYLKVDKVFLLCLTGPTDADLALQEVLFMKSQLGVNVLVGSVYHENFPGSLIIDLYAESSLLRDPRFFHHDVHWLAKDMPLSEAPDLLRFDSNFFVPILQADNETWSLSEMYKVPSIQGGKEREIAMDRVRFWSAQDGIKIQNQVWDRRHLHGLTLRVTTVPSPIFAWDQENDGVYSGLIVDIIKRMEAFSNFTAQWIVPPDGAYGSQNPDGSWNGMVGLLEQDKADMSAALLSISLSRSQVISYAHAYLETKSTLMATDRTFKGASGSVNFTGYLDVFTEKAWMYLVAVLIIEAAAFCIFLRYYGGTGSFVINLAKSVLTVGESLVKLSLSSTFKFTNISGKCLLWTVAISPIVIVCYYEGLLTSYLTISVPPFSLKSVADILITGHKIVLVQGSNQLEDFKNSPPGSARKRVYDVLIKDSTDALVESTQEMDQVVASDPKFVGAASLIKGYVAPNGLYGLMGLDEAIPDPLAFALQKDSEYLGLVNHNMVRMYQSGVIDFIKNKWLSLRKPEDICHDVSSDQSAR